MTTEAKYIDVDGRKVEVIGDHPKDGDEIEYGWEYINLRPNMPRRFGWWSEHTSDKNITGKCLANVCRVKINLDQL